MSKETAYIQALKHKDMIIVRVFYRYLLSCTDKIAAWENKMGGSRKDEASFALWQNWLYWKFIFVYVTQRNKE